MNTKGRDRQYGRTVGGGGGGGGEDVVVGEKARQGKVDVKVPKVSKVVSEVACADRPQRVELRSIIAHGRVSRDVHFCSHRA